MNPPRNVSAPGVTGAGSHGNGCTTKSTRPLASVRELLRARRSDPLAAHLAELVAALEELAAIERRRRVA